MNAKTLCLLCLATLTGQASASSDDAWAALEQAIRISCTQASGLQNPNPVGTIAQFPDQVGVSALLLQGRYPQKHMRGQSGIELCLYNRQTGQAAVSEWDSIRPALKAR
ncbi:hypothetical protein [Pseudomonas protegens]|uniref:hypothetical protein n=1 Tax=Pseudomonas protegens TaxID=380021 RepID=UPI000CCF7539|nr:hypothetical protein [Pseudomonas protegens]MDK1396500.1 hypothetical protein [Pseudomonas protegens]PNV99944.1 hypothetical protein C1633_01010 [Pseudomonas protegens]UVM09956.1 hypothetical protein LOY29_25555 [Pseudomonas protegens]